MVVGAASHYGRAELVSVGARAKAPIVLDRRRVELIGPGLPSSPYHHEALEIGLDDAEVLIARVRLSVAEHARAALSEVQSQYGAASIVVQQSPFDRLPDSLADVMASRRLTVAADGMMYREAVADVGAQLGLEVIRYPRKADEMQMAADKLGVGRDEVVLLIDGLGRVLGPPWRKEHRNAAATALWALARIADVRI